MSTGAIAEVLSGAVPAMQQAIERAGDCSASAEDQLTAANSFAEALADLWEQLESGGEHLCALLELLDMAVSELPQRAQDGDAEAAVHVLELLALLEAHVEEPGEAEIIEALVEMATSEVFDPPLSTEAAAGWLALLEVDDARQPQPAEPARPVQEMLVEQAAVSTDSGGNAPAPGVADAEDAAPEEADELSDDALELLAILSAAFEDLSDELNQRLDDLGCEDSPERRQNAAASIQEMLLCLADAASQVGFLSFSTFCSSVGFKILAMPAEQRWAYPHIDELKQLTPRIQHYLFDPLNETRRIELIELLCASYWNEPLSKQNAVALIEGLRTEPLMLEAEARPERPTLIEAADLALELAEDIDASVVASFRREGPELALQLAQALQQLLDGQGGEESVRQAQRLAHTIKGSANVCGLRAIAVLGHHMEDLLEFLAEEALLPGPALGDVLTAGADGLALMLDVVDGTETYDANAFRSIMQEVLDWANRIDREGRAALAGAAPASAGATDQPLDQDEHAEQPALSSSPDETDPEDACLQIPVRTINELLRLVGELSMALSQSEEQLGRAQRILRESREIETRNLHHLALLEDLVDLRGLGTRQSANPRANAALEEQFDPIELEQYNEMYTGTRRLHEDLSDVRELSQSLDHTLNSLSELSLQEIKLNQQLRQIAMGTRLVPVKGLVPRLQRAVRQTCRTTGKEAELVVHGADASLDGDLLERLMPAMMHIVRNCIDHGIEPPEEREAAGKASQGHIEIHFRQLGDQIEVEIQDDGRGLDLARIRDKALNKGMIDEDADLSDQELAMLTLRPGFSTRDQVTQVSGRGVGMDVVASTIRALNATLELETESGRGYRCRARLPSSMLAIYCLLVRSNDQLLAVQANEVRLALLPQPESLYETPEGWMLRHDDGECPVIWLSTLMGQSAHDLRHPHQVALLLETDTGEQAVMVDALLEGRELIIKKLNALAPRIPGLSAASILGDGSVVPIIELRTLISVASGCDLSAFMVDEQDVVLQLPSVLIVDDSLSMRRVLSRLVEDAGLRALSARDGMDAVRVLAKESVDAVLVDMEMPQMNGLELTARLRTQPETAQLPIAMITSRSTERHRREALQAGVNAYFVKPYRDDEVLDFLQQSMEQVS